MNKKYYLCHYVKGSEMKWSNRRGKVLAVATLLLLVMGVVQARYDNGYLASYSGISVHRHVDLRYRVVCYISEGYKSGGISCLPMRKP